MKNIEDAYKYNQDEIEAVRRNISDKQSLIKQTEAEIKAENVKLKTLKAEEELIKSIYKPEVKGE